MKVHLVLGYSGAGKSTYVRGLEEAGARVLGSYHTLLGGGADEIKHQLGEAGLRAEIDRLAAEGYVTFDIAYLSKKTIRHLHQTWDFSVTYLDIPREVAMERRDQRGGRTGPYRRKAASMPHVYDATDNTLRDIKALGIPVTVIR